MKYLRDILVEESIGKLNFHQRQSPYLIPYIDKFTPPQEAIMAIDQLLKHYNKDTISFLKEMRQEIKCELAHRGPIKTKYAKE